MEPHWIVVNVQNVQIVFFKDANEPAIMIAERWLNKHKITTATIEFDVDFNKPILPPWLAEYELGL